MKTQEQIINEAKEAYESHFEDGKEVTDEAFRGHDVVLDKEELEKEIETKKVEEEKKHLSEMTNALKEQQLSKKKH